MRRIRVTGAAAGRVCRASWRPFQREHGRRNAVRVVKALGRACSTDPYDITMVLRRGSARVRLAARHEAARRWFVGGR